MVELAHDRALKAQEIAGQHVVEHLPTPVGQGLVAEGPAGKDGEEVRVVRALGEQGRAGIDGELSGLERGDEVDLRWAELAEIGKHPKRALFARHTQGRIPEDLIHRLTASSSQEARPSGTSKWRLPGGTSNLNDT